MSGGQHHQARIPAGAHTDTAEITTSARFHGCLIGLACGDAVGTSVEFRPRGSFAPLTDMVGGGPFDLQPGEWTDDTSMALCLAESLVERGFDPADQMRRYVRWMDHGHLSSNGTCFDIGLTVEAALSRFKETGEAFSGDTDPRSAGNGCLMRLAPVPMYSFSSRADAVALSGASARTTHGAAECVEASELFGAMLWQALAGAPKEAILLEHGVNGLASTRLRAIAAGDYRGRDRASIRGSGYVVDSLEAALWCFAGTDDFEAAVLRAANLGDDADTTAAICGQLAGAFYGLENIPLSWRTTLALADTIAALADALLRHAAVSRAVR